MRRGPKEDIEQYREPYKLYQKLKSGKEVEHRGLPIALWAAVSKAEVDQLLLAYLSRRSPGGRAHQRQVPEPIMQLALRQADDRSARTQGKFAAIIDDLRSQRDALQAELTEARVALSSANSVIAICKTDLRHRHLAA